MRVRAQHQQRDSEAGFTLIELLVVILIIGILAAIALPAFLNQRSKAQDSNAKSDVRNLASQIEACWNDNQTYVGCGASLTTSSTGLPVGPGVAQVRVDIETVNGYEISATSKAKDGGGNHVFTIVHNIGGVFDRQCTVAGYGGCRSDGSW